MVALERSSLEMRTPAPPARVLRSMHERLSLRPSEMSGVVCDGRIELYLPPERLSLHSPQLVVDVEPATTRGSGSILRARYGLHPHVWALSLAFAAICICGASAALLFGYAQWVLGQTPHALWGVVASACVGLAFHLLRQRAQSTGAAQQSELRRFLEAGLSEAESARLER